MSRTILALSLLPTTASAAVLNVPTDHATLEDAVAASAAGDTINLDSGTYDVDVTVDHTLTIQALPDATVILRNTLTTSGQVINVTSGAAGITLRDLYFVTSGTNRALTVDGVSQVSLFDVEATSLVSDAEGAFVKATDVNSLLLTDVTVIGVSATAGGAVHLVRSDTTTNALVSVRDSVFETGEVTGDGGLFFVENADLQLYDSTLADSTAGGNGGAIFARNTGRVRTLRLRNSLVAGNYALELGGGAYIQGLSHTMDESSYADNAGSSGGAVWLDQEAQANQAFTTTNNAAFIGNEAHGMGSSAAAMEGTGGAIHAVVDRLDLTFASLTDNVAHSATVWHEGNTFEADDVELHDNTATVGNAGVHASAVTSLTVQDTQASGNHGPGDGGAFWLSGPETTLTRLEAWENSTEGSGGAAWVDGALTIDGSSLKDNSAALGGAVFRDGELLDLSISETQLFRNQADDGGAIHASNIDQLALTRNHWCENSAGTPGLGGGAFFAGTGSVVVRNDGANDNAAEGGAVYSFDGFGDIDVQNSTFAGNSATNGAVFHASNIAGSTILTDLAVTGSTGLAFEGTTVAGLTTSRIGVTGNDLGELGGDWAAEVIDPLIDLSEDFLFNNHPADACEDTRLFPHARNTTLRAIDDTVEDLGLSGGPDADPDLRRDLDLDGFDLIDDCGNDDDASIHPEAPDVCDGIDNDCDFVEGSEDGGIDEDPDTQWFADDDEDGFGSADDVFDTLQCEAPDGLWVQNADDCIDDDPLINPDATEVCDGVDNDCDDTIDAGAADATEYFPDDDFDGFGRLTDSVFECAQPEGYTLVVGDCDDTLANVFPGAEERCDTIDNDCDGEVDVNATDAPVWYADVDVDGYGDGEGIVQCLPPLDHSPYDGDCDDNDPDRNPGRPEVCDGVDNDCEGTIDENPIEPRYYLDNDGDGFGDENMEPVGSCNPLPGYILDGGDCNDAAAAIHPGAPEACDGVDEDCDGSVDENPTNGNTYYLDSDQDGFGNDGYPILACELPVFAAAVGGDCNDNRDDQYPGNDEICDQRDNDCDGETDEPDALDAIVWYADVDDDNFGDDALTAVGCTAPIGHVAQGGDCDDNNPSSYPNRPEVCDGIDNDCNGQVDGADAADVQFFYEDADGDGYGNPDAELGACFLPEGYTTNDDDCDDTRDTVFPNAQEVFGNGIDENCDGQDPPATEPTDPEPTGGDNECGCSTGSANGTLAFLPLVGALLLRRRRK